MVSTVRSTPFLMSSKWFGSTETVGSSTKRCSSNSYSSRCEFAKDKRLSRFNVVDIQILRRTVVRELARAIIKHSWTGDQSPNRGIYMPTAFLQKTSSGALRTFKRFGASCYSGVPVFRSDPAQTVRTNDLQVSVLGGLREKKVFCPWNTLPRYCPGTSRIDYCPAK